MVALPEVHAAGVLLAEGHGLCLKTVHTGFMSHLRSVSSQYSSSAKENASEVQLILWIASCSLV